MKARELVPQTAYDYYASGANDENTLRENRVDHLNVRTNTDLGTFMFSVRYSYELQLLDQFGLNKGLANLGGSLPNLRVYPPFIFIHLLRSIPLFPLPLPHDF